LKALSLPKGKDLQLWITSKDQGRTYNLALKARPYPSPGQSPGNSSCESEKGLKVRDKICIMSQSLAHILVHIIFSTRDRQPFLQHPMRHDLHAYIAT